jgi:hypothetical protein
MTFHTEHALASSRVAKLRDFLFAVSTFEAHGAKGFIAAQNSQIVNVPSALAAAIRAVIANKPAVAEK